MSSTIETAVREAGIRAEWYATGILDTGSDSRVGNDECIAFGDHYAGLARAFHEERSSHLRNVRDEWRFWIEQRAAASKAEQRAASGQTSIVRLIGYP